jgi:hypothetical protein
MARPVPDPESGVSTIVFIGAVGRSGTTLLERTLATAPRIVALGEMVHLWHRGLEQDEPCGCGARFSECPFWTAVGQSAFGGWSNVDVAAVNRDRRTVDRNRRLPFLIARWLAPRGFRAAHGRLVAVLDAVYTAAHDVASEGRDDVVLVDSSKHPSYLFLMRSLPHHSVRLLHVTRDPRGVVNSWSKFTLRPESGTAMEQLGTAKGCARWVSHNLLFQLAGLVGVRRQRLAYETFNRDVTALGRAVEPLLDDGRPVALDVVGSTVTLGTDHTVSGNPMRFQHGSIDVRPDERWRTTMPKRRQRLIATVTTPMRQVYSR